jgi:hypothetical protein
MCGIIWCKKVRTMNWSHIRRISIVLRAVEDATIEIEGVLEGRGGRQRLMTTFDDDIPDSVKPNVIGKLEQIRSGIQDLKNYYGLESDRISNRRRISTKLSILAIDLTECLSRYLRGYGEVPEEEQAPLDERVSRLEGLLNEVNRLVGSSGQT